MKLKVVNVRYLEALEMRLKLQPNHAFIPLRNALQLPSRRPKLYYTLI
jgi:hypothetical protein